MKGFSLDLKLIPTLETIWIADLQHAYQERTYDGYVHALRLLSEVTQHPVSGFDAHTTRFYDLFNKFLFAVSTVKHYNTCRCALIVLSSQSRISKWEVYCSNGKHRQFIPQGGWEPEPV